MIGRPWMKFYPSDWRAEPRLRMCSLAARGLWIDLISYMHEGSPYGHLTIDGIEPSIDNIAALVASSKTEVTKALAELERCQVFSRTEGGVIFSRRMKRDNQKNITDRQNGKGGGNPHLLHPVIQGVNPPLKAQKLEARVQSPEREETRARGALGPDWPPDYRDQFWDRFPNKIGKKDALQKLDRVARSGAVTFAEVMEALGRYAGKADDRPFCNPATWINQERWTDVPAAAPHGKRTIQQTAADLLDKMRDITGGVRDEAGDGLVRRLSAR